MRKANKKNSLIRKIYYKTPWKRELNRLLQRIQTLESTLETLEQSILDMHLPVDLNTDNSSEPVSLEGYSLEACYASLRKIAPVAFKAYMKLMDNNIHIYEGLPIHSCSMEGHKEAERFGKFIARFLRGYVLDVGCGPQSIPFYLKILGGGYKKLYGIDPIVGEQEFEFKQAISEFIPWEKDSFDCVIFATSLDHIFLPEKVWEEVKRVLKPNGVLLIWTSFDENAPVYNPYDESFVPYDQFHMFHYSQKQLEKELDSMFEKIEYFKSDQNSHFYAYRIKN